MNSLPKRVRSVAVFLGQRSLVRGGLLLAVLAAAIAPAPAATVYVWKTTTGGSWTTAANWNPTGTITTDDTADFSTLNITADAAVTLDGAQTVGNLKFGDATTASHNWFLNTGTGGSLTLSVSTGVPLITVTNQTATINAPLTSTAGFTKAGTGTLTLNTLSAGSYDIGGAITVSGGMLRVLDPNALSGATTLAVQTGAMLALDAGGAASSQTFGATKSITLVGGGNNYGALQSILGTTTWAGNIVLGADQARLGGASGATLNVSGTISSGANNYALVIRNTTATGTVTLSGNNTYLGHTWIYIGNLRLGTTNALPLGTALNLVAGVGNALVDLNGNNQTVTGVYSGVDAVNSKVVSNTSGTLSTLSILTPYSQTFSLAGLLTGNLRVVKNSPGNQTFSGANTYTGGTSLLGGTLTLAQTSGTTLGSGSVTLGPGTLAFAPTTGNASVTAADGAGSTVSADGGGMLSLKRTTGNTLTVTLGNASAGAGTVIARGTAGGTLALIPNGGTAAANLGVNEKLLVNGGVSLVINDGVNGVMVAPWLFGQDNDGKSTADFLRYDSTAGLVRASYATSTDLNGGTAFADSRVFEATAATTNTLNASSAVLALKNGGQTIDTAGNTLAIGNNVDPAGLILNGGQIGTSATPGTLSFGSAQAVIITNSDGGTIYSALRATGLVKAGTGLLNVVGDTTNLSGGVWVNGGVLRLPSALPSGNLNLGGGVYEIGALNGTVARALGAADGQVQVGGGASGFSYNAASGKGTVTLGADLSTVSWDSPYFKPSTFVLNSTLANNPIDLRNGLDLAGASRTISVGASTATVLGAISNSTPQYPAGLIKVGNGILALAGANSYNGPTLIKGGTLSVASLANGGVDSGLGNSSNAASNLQLDAGTTLRYTGGTASTDRAMTLNATSGTAIATLDASGSGAVTFSNINGLAFGSTSGAHTLVLTGTNVGSNTLAATIKNDGANLTNLTKSGTGTWVLTGTSTYTGVTTISAGVLRVQNSSALGATSGITVADKARLELAGGVTIDRSVNIAGNGNNNSGALQNNSGDNTWSGNVTLTNVTGGTRIGAMAGTLRITGVIDSGASAVDLNIRNADGGGLVILSGANTYLGNTTVVVGTLQLAGGDNRLPTAGLINLGNGSNIATATLDLGGTNQQSAGLISAGTTMTTTLTNSSATASTLTLDLAAATNRSYLSVISGNLAVVKQGTGTQRFSGATTYTGNTTVSAGTLALAHTSSNNIASSPTITVAGGTTLDTSGLNGGGLTLASGQTLGGNGTVHGGVTVTASSTLAPGMSPGTLTIDNGLTFTGGTLSMEINGTSPGVDYDQLAVTNGAVALGNGIATLLLSTSGYTPAVGDLLWIINNSGSGSTTGYFNGLAQGATLTLAGQEFSVSYTGDYGTTNAYSTSGNDMVLVAAPEPSTWAMLIGGLAAAGFYWRRQRKLAVE